MCSGMLSSILTVCQKGHGKAVRLIRFQQKPRSTDKESDLEGERELDCNGKHEVSNSPQDEQDIELSE
eukprot:6489477-Amphidinium_carterae.1